MELYPTVKIIFDRRKKAGPKTEGYVEIELYHNRSRKWISTGVKVLPKNWHQKKGVVGRIDSNDLNLRIEVVKQKINDCIRGLFIEEIPFSWDVLNNMLEIADDKSSFIDFVEKRVNERMDIKSSTKKNHRKLVAVLKEFNRIRRFSDLNKTNIMAYDEWLRKRYPYTQTTIASYHKFMKIYVNEAIRNEYISINPYDAIKIARGKSEVRRFLEPDEVRRIEEVELPTDSLMKTRDVFIFQCYTGLAYADMKGFDFKKVVLRNGKYILHDTRRKTGEQYHIVLLPQAVRILEKYGYVLPVISNQQYNMRLKIIADAAKLDKGLTSHMGRHTYATMCLNAGISVEILARMMGHSDIATTQIYARLLNKTVDAAYDELAEKLK